MLIWLRCGILFITCCMTIPHASREMTACGHWRSRLQRRSPTYRVGRVPSSADINLGEDIMNLTNAVAYKSPLHEMTQSTPTRLWNDSAAIKELSYSIEHGAVGATCNPVIALGVLKK